jgi:hypothetical protein
MDAPGKAEVGAKEAQQVRCQLAPRGDFYRPCDENLKNPRTFRRVKDSMAGSFLHGASSAFRLRGRTAAKCAMFAMERQTLRGGLERVGSRGVRHGRAGAYAREERLRKGRSNSRQKAAAMPM